MVLISAWDALMVVHSWSRMQSCMLGSGHGCTCLRVGGRSERQIVIIRVRCEPRPVGAANRTLVGHDGLAAQQALLGLDIGHH